MNPRLACPLLLLALPAAAHAVEIDRNSPRIQLTHVAGMDFKTTGGGLDSTTIELRTPLSKAIHLGKNTLMSVNLAYDGTGLDFGGTTAGFPLPDARLHEIEFPILARWESADSPWTITYGLSPGLASDFDHVDGDDFFLGGRLVFERVINGQLKIGFGAAVIRSLGDNAILPAAGFEWRPADAWLVELAGPYLNIWWQPSDDWLARLGAGPGGGVWNVDWNNLSRDLSLSNFLVGIAVEHQLAEGVWLSAGTGVSLANHLELTTTGGLTTYKSGLDNGWFASLGLRVASW